MADADAHWEGYGPERVPLPALDLTVARPWAVDGLVVEAGSQNLRATLQQAVLALGGEAADFHVERAVGRRRGGRARSARHD